ncbi:MAG: ATP-binding protein [Mycobacteriales bacterium]
MIATRRRTAAEPVQAIELPVDPLSAGRARRFVTDALHGWALDDLADEATLLTSEVVTNALLHAGSERICLRLRRLADGVRVEVDDESALLPRPRRVSRLSDTGRGIGLVEDGARAWGARPTAQGKTVWFEIATS